MPSIILLLLTLITSSTAMAATGAVENLDLTTPWGGYTAIVIFLLAYILVILEKGLSRKI
ncbi:MAG: hypothetical protein ACJAYG_001877 [Oceanicoccus sp.]|jgi:hypothetical protein